MHSQDVGPIAQPVEQRTFNPSVIDFKRERNT